MFCIFVLGLLMLGASALLPEADQEDVINAGVKIRLTKKAFDDVNEVFLDLLDAFAEPGTELPDYKQHIPGVGHVEFKDLEIEDFPRPTLRTEFIPGTGLGVKVENVSPTIVGTYTFKTKIFIFTVRKRGTFKLTAQNLFAKSLFHKNHWNSDHPTMTSYACDLGGNIKVDFKGDMASFLETAFAISFPALRRNFKSQMCKGITNFLDDKLAPFIISTQEPFFITPGLAMEYGYEAAPEFYQDAVESKHAGRFSHIDEEGTMMESPYEAPDLPPIHDFDERHIYIFMSEYTSNTLLFAGTVSNLFQQRVTKDHLPPEKASYLQTTCENGECIGSYIPNLSSDHPDRYVTLTTQPLEAPVIKFKNSSVGLTASVHLQVGVEQGDTEQADTELIYTTIGLEIDITMEGEFKDHKFFFTVNDASIRFSAADDMAGVEQEVDNEIIKSLLINRINNFGQAGIELPEVTGLKLNCKMFTDPRLPGVMILATDFDLMHDELVGLLQAL